MERLGEGQGGTPASQKKGAGPPRGGPAPQGISRALASRRRLDLRVCGVVGLSQYSMTFAHTASGSVVYTKPLSYVRRQNGTTDHLFFDCELQMVNPLYSMVACFPVPGNGGGGWSFSPVRSGDDRARFGDGVE